MLYTVVKNHRVASGETSSSTKYDTLKEALRNHHQFAANYLADDSVLAWSVSVIETNAGEDMRIIELASYSDKEITA